MDECADADANADADTALSQDAADTTKAETNVTLGSSITLKSRYGRSLTFKSKDMNSSAVRLKVHSNTYY